MKLPIEASDDDGILTKNGTMIYGKEDDAVTIGVQPLKDETGNVSFEGVRTLITINAVSYTHLTKTAEKQLLWIRHMLMEVMGR